MKYNGFFVLLLFCFLALFVSPVSAGGGLISFDVVGDKDSWNMVPGDQYVVRLRTEKGGNASNQPVKILLENPMPDDYIAQSSDKIDENGSMYAKVISKVPGNRVVYAEVLMPDGSTYRSSVYILAYQGGTPPMPVYPTSVPTPYTNTYENSYPTAPPIMDQPLVLTVTHQKYLSGVKREVGLSWNKVTGAIKYNVYARFTDDNDWGAAIVGTGDQSAIININAFETYYLKVDACVAADKCYPAADVFLEAMGPSTEVKPTVIVDKSVEQLYDQVQSLKKELDDSKQKQNELQKLISNLIATLKRFLPF